MISDFVAITHEIEPRNVKVWCIADVHLGSAECMLDEFKAWLKRVESDPDSYVIIAGDVMDNSTRNSIGAGVYENKLTPQQQLDLAVQLLRPLADSGKILAVVGGNHEARTAKECDLDPLYTVCCILGIQNVYRKAMASVRVIMRKGRNMRQLYTFLVLHGKSDNKRKWFELAIEGYDVLVTGHTHSGLVTKPAKMRIDPQSGNISIKPMVSLVATSWLHFGGYGASEMYTPKVSANPQHILLEWTNTGSRAGVPTVVW